MVTNDIHGTCFFDVLMMLLNFTFFLMTHTHTLGILVRHKRIFIRLVFYVSTLYSSLFFSIIISNTVDDHHGRSTLPAFFPLPKRICFAHDGRLTSSFVVPQILSFDFYSTSSMKYSARGSPHDTCSLFLTFFLSSVRIVFLES